MQSTPATSGQEIQDLKLPCDNLVSGLRALYHATGRMPGIKVQKQGPKYPQTDIWKSIEI